RRRQHEQVLGPLPRPARTQQRPAGCAPLVGRPHGRLVRLAGEPETSPLGTRSCLERVDHGPGLRLRAAKRSCPAPVAARVRWQRGYDVTQHTDSTRRPLDPDTAEKPLAQPPFGEDPLTGTSAWRNAHTV